ncbi:MAG: kynureninase [Planctomycetaceae bacterium]|nr:kynureninase [Planctomycetaceae bacterium]
MTETTHSPQQAMTRALQLDRDDPLTSLRNRFLIPGTPAADDVYFVGNSLGLQPRSTREHVMQVMDQWHHAGVHGHFDGEPAWMDLPQMISDRMAPLVGASPQEVVVMNTLTVNLHLMLASFFRPHGQRTKILIEEHAFPSDHQAVASFLQLHGLDPAEHLIVVGPAPGEALISVSQLTDAMTAHASELALCLLPGVQYYTGQVFDMPTLTETAHRRGIVIGFDLAHAAGNIELDLHDWNVDFACWCTYKYLNCGPGAPGACFIHERHATNIHHPRLAGWWGHERGSRFQMAAEFVPPPTAQGWQLSNPPMLAMATMLPALEIFEAAGGLKPLRERSRRQNAFFRQLLTEQLPDHVHIVTPDTPLAGGCQLSLEIQCEGTSGREVFDRISSRGVHTDWREPNVIRAAPVPLYNTFEDIARFVATLTESLSADN